MRSRSAAAAGEIKAFAVKTDRAPVPPPSAPPFSQPRPYGRLARIDLINEALFRLGEFLFAFTRGENVGAGHEAGAAEPAIEMHALDREPEMGEVGEPRIEPGLGVAAQIAQARPRIGTTLDSAAECEPRMIEGVASIVSFRQQQRSAIVMGEISGMAGERRHEQERRAVEVARDADQRGQRSALPLERGESAGPREPHEQLRGGDRCSIGRLRPGKDLGHRELEGLRRSPKRNPAGSRVKRRRAPATPSAGQCAQIRGKLVRIGVRPHLRFACSGGLSPRMEHISAANGSDKPCGPTLAVLADTRNGRLMPTIALVDDDRNILTSVSLSLEAEGYRVQTYTDGASALEGLKSAPPDLAIFDIKMPRMDGMELLRRLRQKSDLPVIFLTSKDEEIDELFGLKMGADDFIRKPFSQRLLVERVKAILRRSNPKDSGTPKESEAKILERGRLKMDPERHTCTWDETSVTLTVTEFLILQALATRPGVVKSRNALMDAAYDDQVYVDDRTIDSHIKRLRKKFKVVEPEFEMIETLYGVGYRFKEG